MACGIVTSLQEGVALAREVQRSGKAKDLLDAWISLSQVISLVLVFAVRQFSFPSLVK